MLKNFLLLLTMTLYFFACGQTTTNSDPTKDQPFGEKVKTENALTFNELLTKMDSQDSLQTKVIGTVESVCKKKGCWANIVADDGREMFVKFKDYGFFLPLDCEGRKIVMEGQAFREVTSVEELQHYAEDEGASKEEIAKITEPKEELKFLASGVMLLKDEKK